jgi:phosphoesterase RecJ-like protein
MSAADSFSAFSAFDALVRDRQRFVLTTHVNPDGDGLGSEVALGLWLRAKGKDVAILNDGKAPWNFDFLARHFPLDHWTPERAEELFAKAEVLVVLDTQNKERLGRIAPYADRKGLDVVVLDHHVGDAAFGTVNVVQPEKAATGELVYDLIRREPNALTTPIAEALYAALVTDTGSFRHSNTDPDVHAMAGDLLARGVESAVVQARINASRNVDRLRFVGRLLTELQTTSDGTVAWFEVRRDHLKRYGVESSDTEGLVDFPRSVPGVEAVLLLTELEDGRVKSSLRSSGRVDVHAVATELGGGGHRYAAGATLDGPIEAARDRVIGLLQGAISRLDPGARRYAGAAEARR